jgi:hypothetical protein
MANGNGHTEIEMTDLDWFIIDMFCKDIIGPRHEVERYPDPNEAIDMMIQDKIDREEGL